MKFVAPFLVFTLATFAVFPVFAGEGANVSYSLKKQGRVHFQAKADDQMSVATDAMTDMVHPADIEPAAGGFSPEESDAGKTSLSERMRLPRKN